MAATAAADVISGASTAAKTRVRGIDLTGYAGIWGSTLASAETRWASTLSCDETAAGRPVVTNLRLPGQYDERLLGSLGLQGPYYNWNRWYLPGVGRYLELDPVGLTGRFNAPFRPDWYNYASGNPVRFVDPTGLLVELYCENLSTARHGLGGLGVHCFVRVACEDCGQSYDRTLEIISPLPMSPFVGRPQDNPFDPTFNERGSTRRRGMSGPGRPGKCGTERCILDAFQQLGANLPEYNGTGPNSNTFASQMLSECGLQGDFPWNAVGAQ